MDATLVGSLARPPVGFREVSEKKGRRSRNVESF